MKLFTRVFLLVLIASMPLWANQIKMTMDPPSLTLGEDARLKVDISGKTQGQIGVLKWPVCPGIQFNWNDKQQSSSTQIINGQFSQQFSLTFGARAVKEGRFTISPIILQIGGKKISSNPAVVQVAKRQKSNFYHLKSSIPFTQCYVGQMIPLKLEFLVSDQVVRQIERHVGKYEMATQQYNGIALPKSLKQDFNVHPKSFRKANKAEVYFGNDAGAKNFGQHRYRVHELVFLLEAKRTGRLEVPAFTTNFFDLQVSRNFFNYQLNRRGGGIPASTEKIILKVSEPPKEGRPTTYAGLICEKLSAKLIVEDLTPGQNVMIHDPISIQLEIKSEVPADRLQLPNWSTQQKLQSGFDISSHQAVREDVKSGILFKEITIRPKKDDIDAIPPIEISYFNVRLGQYQTVRTRSFPLKIKKVSKVKQMANQSLPVLQLQKDDEQKTTVGHLEGLEQSPDLLSKPHSKSSHLPWLLVLSVLPWIGVSAKTLYPVLSKMKSEQRAREKHGLNDTLRKLAATKDISESLQLISNYISHKFGITDPTALKLEDKDLEQRTRDILGAYASAGYSGGSGDTLPSAQEIKSWLDALDKAKRS